MLKSSKESSGGEGSGGFGSRNNQVRFILSMVVEMVPVKGGIGGIVHPPIGRKNTTYIPLI